MKFILLVYNDPAALDSLPAGDFDNRCGIASRTRTS
jgi:hypothetical protein